MKTAKHVANTTVNTVLNFVYYGSAAANVAAGVAGLVTSGAGMAVNALGTGVTAVGAGITIAGSPTLGLVVGGIGSAVKASSKIALVPIHSVTRTIFAVTYIAKLTVPAVQYFITPKKREEGLEDKLEANEEELQELDTSLFVESNQDNVQIEFDIVGQVEDVAAL